MRVHPNSSDLELTLINSYTAKTGSLRVRKIVDGAGAPLRGDVVLDVSCTDGTTDTLVVPPGQAVSELVIANVVATSQCTVTESSTGAVPGVVDVVVTPPGPQTVTIVEDVESVVEVRQHLHARARDPAGHQDRDRTRGWQSGRGRGRSHV